MGNPQMPAQVFNLSPSFHTPRPTVWSEILEPQIWTWKSWFLEAGDFPPITSHFHFPIAWSLNPHPKPRVRGGCETQACTRIPVLIADPPAWLLMAYINQAHLTCPSPRQPPWVPAAAASPQHPRPQCLCTCVFLSFFFPELIGNCSYLKCSCLRGWISVLSASYLQKASYLRAARCHHT